MKIKIIASYDEKKVENEANKFLATEGIKALEFHYKNQIFLYSVMVVYEEISEV